MATCKYSIKTPPGLRSDIPYKNGKEEIAIFFSLEGKARESASENDVEAFNKDDGVDTILAQLDKLH